jgi:hypothetical protein
VLTAANEYEKLTGKKNILAHALADALVAIRDFDSAASLRDEMTAAAQSEAMRNEKTKQEKKQKT